VFDLDGTICDSAASIASALNYALSELGRETLPEKGILHYIGPHPEAVFIELLRTSDRAVISSAVELYRYHYADSAYSKSILYCDMGDVLRELQNAGFTLCVATAKPKYIAEKILKFLGVGSQFSLVLGGDSYREKADMLTEIMTDLESGNTIMIGDRDTDFGAASEVHIPSIGVKWGYGAERELELATAVVNKPRELSDTIRRLLLSSMGNNSTDST